MERDHAHGVPCIAGAHSLEAFGRDLLDAYRAGAPAVVRDGPTDPRLGEEARAGLAARLVGAFVDVVTRHGARSRSAGHRSSDAGRDADRPRVAKPFRNAELAASLAGLPAVAWRIAKP